ncbi:FG-GAP-like repeat-containing protein [Actinoplanes solisilvae]|uniref:FG-GAP-like repeat-containing protein n=1 Tax=Actinoplanes solisilvae TaxID=2486853 RepID=UPI000FD75F10|nr:tyrosinase family protein [Actinoplanes solisilvae]
MQFVLSNFGYNAGTWRVEKHPRFVTDLTGDGSADILGFGDDGVWVSTNTGNGSFDTPRLDVANFAYNAGNWRVERHPRELADITGDGIPDIVGFGNGGVWVSVNDGKGHFGEPRLVIANFGYAAGGWRVERHPRFLADVTGDRRADIVGFGDDGVWISRNNGNGTFAAPALAVANFGYNAGQWRVEKHPRFVADLTGDGRADIIGFGDDGVWVSRNTGNGTFAQPTMVVANFAFNAGRWRVERHPRLLADTTGDGLPDIVGFGDDGVWVSRNTGNGTFAQPTMVVANFGYNAGTWRVEKHPRFAADLTGDRRADIIGFGDDGVWVSRNTGNSTFPQPTMVVPNFAHDAGRWRVERHPRVLADVTGDRRLDIVGFGDDGVWTAHNNGDGTFRTFRVRRDIWDLQANGPWDSYTLAYARAVRAMQARALTDPRGWQYQAAVHGRAGAAPVGVVWNECQHGSWHFLPWHRAFLYYFEEIVRAEVVAQGGPSDWALPYWNYAIAGRNVLPPAFREPTMPDGSPNPLFVANRNPAVNTGATLPSTSTSASAALAQTAFTPGFGGGRTTPQHFFNQFGELEFTPHNDIHVLIGGWMSNPNLAALDPIFWLHHANIDRIWSLWLAQGGGRADPGETGWRDVSWRLHDGAGNPVTITTAGVLDTMGQLGYVYQDGRARTRSGQERFMSDAQPADGPEPELVGASDRAIDLTGGPARVEVPIDTRTVTARRQGPASEQVLLNLEDVEAEQTPETVYEVFVRPIDAPDETPFYVGNVSFFGIEHLGERGPAEDGPHGFRRTFDISAWVAGRRARGEWSDQGVAVTFRPVRVEPQADPSAMRARGIDESAVAETIAAQEAPVRIGRVSLFYR